MRALTFAPLKCGSTRLEEVPEPSLHDGDLLVQTLAIGVCGTDRDLLRGVYGFATPGKARLILGHESLGTVLEAPAGSGFARGDLVVGVVRRPDPVPCYHCAQGEWDMCRNGRYTERGIKERDGYCSERFRLEPEFAIKVAPKLGLLGVLVEPASVVAKAWEQIEHIGRRSQWHAARCLITGAGPIGLLAALLGMQRGFEVHVLDKVKDGPKPALVRDLGATYHTGSVEEASSAADVILECTGVPQLIWETMNHCAPDGIVCLTGVSSGGRSLQLDLGSLNRTMVLENEVVFGTVNSNLRHYQAGAEALAAANRAWLERLITRRLPLARWAEAMERTPADVKPVIDFAGGD